MRRTLKILLIILVAFTLTVTPVSSIYRSTVMITVEAHSGRTDSSGGHKDNKNKSGLGSYHYHCSGNPAHLHSKGICPYSSSNTTSNTDQSSSSSNSKKSESKETTQSEIVKKVQTELNRLGYECGTADGINGKKTIKALKKYQEDNGLTVDGIIGKQVKKALDIS